MKTAKEAYKTLSEYVNNSVRNDDEFINEFTSDHRYLQGEIIDLCLELLATCAQDSYAYDMRNEYAHKIAVEMKEKIESFSYRCEAIRRKSEKCKEQATS